MARMNRRFHPLWPMLFAVLWLCACGGNFVDPASETSAMVPTGKDSLPPPAGLQDNSPPEETTPEVGAAIPLDRVVVMPPDDVQPLARRVVAHTRDLRSLAAFVQAPGESGLVWSDPRQSERGRVHTFSFVGLFPGADFRYTVYDTDSDEVVARGWFRTPPPPAWYPDHTAVEGSAGFDRTRWIVAVLNTADSLVMPVRSIAIFDRSGRLRMIREIPAQPWGFETLESFQIRSSGSIVVPLTASLIEVQLAGDLAEMFDLSANFNTFHPTHHQFLVDRPGERALVVYNELGPGLQCDLQTPTNMAVGDGILIVNRDGDELWRWSAFDHQNVIRPDMMNQSLCYNFHFGFTVFDWTHGNAAVPFPNQEALLVSLRNVAQLAKIDMATGDVLWQMGPGLDFTWLGGGIPADHWFRMQHDPVWLSPTRLLLFDNGNCRYGDNCLDGPWSRALEIEIDESARTVTPIWEHRVEFSHAQGNTERLADGNTLIFNGWNGRIFEVTPENEEVFYMEFSPLAKAYQVRSYPALWDYRGVAPVGDTP
jgi:Arylsulfotransferase (ASST)